MCPPVLVMNPAQHNEPDAPAMYLSAYLTERDVAPAEVHRNREGGYVVRALGREVLVGTPPEGQIIAWALQAADEVVEHLGNRMLYR